MKESVFNELQLLLSMYDSSQFQFDDPEVPLMLENSFEDVVTLKNINSSCSFAIKLEDPIESELHFRIPIGYPDQDKLSFNCTICYGEKFASSSNEVGMHKKVNDDIGELLNESEGSCDILSVINKFKESCEQYLRTVSSPSSHNSNGIFQSIIYKELFF